MASGYQVNGNDLDNIFAPYHAGWPQAAATGYQVAGADLNGRYAPLSTGTAAAATGYRVAGADLNAIFAAAGSTGVQVGVQPANVAGSWAAGNPSGTVTSAAASCSGAKGSGAYTYEWICTGCTATSPNSDTTTFSADVNAGTTDNASAYCKISDGVSSVNTNVISVALQNTTPAFSGLTDTYNAAGTYTSTVPDGASTMEVEVFGCSAAGGSGFTTTTGDFYGGGGGGSGAYSRSEFAVATDNGKTVSVTIAAENSGSLTTVSSGTLAIAEMTAPAGGTGGGATSTHGGAAGAAAATGTGGNQANAVGNAGLAGSYNTAGSGGVGVAGVNGSGGIGGNGALASGGVAGLGVAGIVIIKYSP